MTLYCGIDLHANKSVVAVLDDDDRTVYERRPPYDLATILEVLRRYQAELAEPPRPHASPHGPDSPSGLSGEPGPQKTFWT